MDRQHFDGSADALSRESVDGADLERRLRCWEAYEKQSSVFSRI